MSLGFMWGREIYNRYPGTENHGRVKLSEFYLIGGGKKTRGQESGAIAGNGIRTRVGRGRTFQRR